MSTVAEKQQMSGGQIVDAILNLFDSNGVDPLGRHEILTEVLSYCHKYNEEKIMVLRTEAEMSIEKASSICQINDRIKLALEGHNTIRATIDGGELKSAAEKQHVSRY